MALKNSNMPFLWVLNPFNNEGDAEEMLPEFLEDTKERGLVVKWCQQDRVLMHPSIACFVSHCGFNSMIETILAGVPVVGFPFYSDHPTDAMLITNVFGNGVRVKCGEDGVTSAPEFERCIWEVTHGPNAKEIKKRALEVKELAKKAAQEGGSADKYIKQFISEITK
ncbi:UDP-glycosyltransferase [Arachis hypogaea]|nr:UDP-glycosyltransferase [Arachis hypogaea]